MTRVLVLVAFASLFAAATPPVRDLVLGQAPCQGGHAICLGDKDHAVVVKGNLLVDSRDGGLVVSTGSFAKVAGVSLATVAPQDGGVSAPLCQFGYGAMTSGALTVTFTKAFTSNPQCTCSHVNTTNSTACVLDSTAVPTTTAAKFLVASGSSDILDWICCGDK